MAYVWSKLNGLNILTSIREQVERFIKGVLSVPSVLLRLCLRRRVRVISRPFSYMYEDIQKFTNGL